MKIKCLQSIGLQGSYAWTCGDGCCSDRDYINIAMPAGEVFILWRGPYGDYIIDDPSGYIDYLDTDIDIKEEEIKKLLENKQIEVVEE